VLKFRRGISNAIFAGTTVVLLIVAGVGFALYLTSSPASHTTTETMTETSSMTSNGTEAVQFAPATGQMIHTGWVLIAPTGSGDYAVSVYAQGLESTQGTGNVYLVEATSSSGAMATAPIGANESASEFETTSAGVGSYLVILMQNPLTSFENIQLVYLPGMQMSNAVVVATATLTMSH
jgi:hypothetical protein